MLLRPIQVEGAWIDVKWTHFGPVGKIHQRDESGGVFCAWIIGCGASEKNGVASEDRVDGKGLFGYWNNTGEVVGRSGF